MIPQLVGGLGGEMGASPPQDGKLFCLACLHARTHAHSELTGRASQKTPRSVRLSIRPPFQLSRVLSVFLDLLVDTLCFFDECLEDFAKLADLESWGRDSHAFTRGI